MKKSWGGLAIILTLFLAGTSTALAADPVYDFFKSVKLVINQKEAEVNYQPALMDQAAYSKNGRTLVPFRFLGESLGAKITWNADKGQAQLSLAGRAVIVTAGSKAAYVDGRMSMLDVPAETRSGRLFIPLRFVSEALGADVTYDDQRQLIQIRSVDQSDWLEYTAPLSGLKYRYPPDWEVSTEDNDTTVVFASPKGTKMYAYWTDQKPGEIDDAIKALAKDHQWTLANEYLDVPGDIDQGFELQFIQYDVVSGKQIWYVILCDPLSEDASIVGEVRLDDDYFEMEMWIMGRILYS